MVYKQQASGREALNCCKISDCQTHGHRNRRLNTVCQKYTSTGTKVICLKDLRQLDSRKAKHEISVDRNVI